MYRPGVLPQSKSIVRCEICNASVKDLSEAAIITCAHTAIHRMTIHNACAIMYGKREADTFLKSERLTAICPRLGGGGAKATLVSNTMLKQLGLQDMLYATAGGKNIKSINGGNGKMPDKRLKTALEVTPLLIPPPFTTFLHEHSPF